MAGSVGNVSKGSGQLRYRAGVPAAPNWLGKYGKIEYSRVVKLMKDADPELLQQVDFTLLTKYAQAWDDIRVYSLALNKEDHVIMSENGGMYMNPNYNLRQNAWKRLDEAASKLGFSPYDRTKLAATSAQAADGFSKFLVKLEQIRNDGQRGKKSR